MKTNLRYLKNVGIIILFLSACGQIENKEKVVKEEKIIETKKREIHLTDGEAKTTANIAIEGMSCAVNCAGTIQKKLSELNGVVNCQVDFDKKVAKVQFDDSKINEQDLISEIQKINAGQYKVTTVEVEKTIIDRINASQQNKDKKEIEETQG